MNDECVSTIKCDCGQLHSLFWLVSGPNRKQLSYRCNKIRKIRKHGKFKGESHSTSGILPASDTIEPAKGLPEQLLTKYRDKLQGEKQQQLMLMK